MKSFKFAKSIFLEIKTNGRQNLCSIWLSQLFTLRILLEDVTVKTSKGVASNLKLRRILLLVCAFLSRSITSTVYCMYCSMTLIPVFLCC